MKTKFLKISKCTLSLVLSLMMLVSSVFVSSGVTIVDTVDTADSTAANTADDTAQADDTTAPKTSKAAKVTPQASGTTGDTVDIYLVDTVGWNSDDVWLFLFTEASPKNQWYKMDRTATGSILYKTSVVSDDANIIVDGNCAFQYGHSNGEWTKQTDDMSTIYSSTVGTGYAYNGTNPYFVLDPANMAGTDNKYYGRWVSDYNTWYLVGTYADTNYAANVSEKMQRIEYSFTKYADNLYRYDTNTTYTDLRTYAWGSQKKFQFKTLSSTGWGDAYGAPSSSDYGIHPGWPTYSSKLTMGSDPVGYLYPRTDKSGTDNVTFWIDTADGNKFYLSTGSSIPSITYSYTFYFDNTSTNWTTPHAHIYNNTGDTYSNDVAMTVENAGEKIYKATFTTTRPSSEFNVRFSNNGSEYKPSSTTGWEVAQGRVYNSDGIAVGYENQLDRYLTENHTTSTYTIYFDALEESGITTPTVTVYNKDDLSTPLTDANSVTLNNVSMTQVTDDVSAAHKIYKCEITTTEAASDLRAEFNNSGTKNNVVANGQVYTSAGAATETDLATYVANNHNEFTLYFDAKTNTWIPTITVYKISGSSTVYSGTMTSYSTGITSANHVYSASFITKNADSALNVKFTGSGTNYPSSNGWTVTNGRVYTVDGATDYTDVTEYAEQTYKDYIYFEKPVYIKDNTTYTSWSTVKAYIFTGSTGDGTSWPGHEMGIDTATGLYSYEVTNNTNTGVVFNNGALEGVDNQNKTANLTLTPGKVYKFDGTTYDYDVYKNQVDNWYVSGVDTLEVQMSPVSGNSGLYVYNTRKTISQLTSGRTFKRKYNDTGIGDPLGATATTDSSKENYYLKSSTLGNGSNSTIDLGSHGYYLSFTKYSSPPAGTVKLYLDVSTLSAPKFYYEVNNYTIDATAETATSYTFYLDNSECGWDAPAAYAYSNPDASTAEDVTEQLLNATWPGKAMTFDTTKNLWKITVSLKKQTFSDATLTSSYPQVVFTDKFINAAGTEIKTGMHQTSPQQLVDGRVYKIASNGTTITTADYDSYTKSTTPALTYYVHNVSSGADTAMTETESGSGIYKLSTSKTIADLSVDSEQFYIVEKGYRGNISHRRPSNTELDQFDRNDKFETSERASGYFFFNDTSVTAGNVDLYYQPATATTTDRFWYTFAADPTFKTVTAADNTTKSALGFEEKSYVAGSTATLKIVRIPEGKAVNTVTVGGSPLAPNSNGEYVFTVDSDKSVTVTLRDKYTFNITMASTDDSATVTASQYTITEGEQIKINAIKGVSDSYDYTFENWTSSENCDLTFVNSENTDVAAVVIPTVNSSTTATDGVVDITITANYNKTNLTPVDNRYIAYKQSSDFPWDYKTYKQLKTLNGKNFVDFSKNDFEGNPNYIGFVLTNAALPNGTDDERKTAMINANTKKIVNKDGENKYVLTSSETGGYYEVQSADRDGYYFTKLVVPSAKWDSLVSVRLYLDDDDTYTFEPIFQEVEQKDKVGNVKFYVKDGTIRNSYQKYTDIADSTVTNNSSSETDTGIHVTDRASYNTRAEYGYGNVGATLSIKTTIQNSYVNKYYVKGFCINGITYNVIDEPAAGDVRRIKSGETGYDSSKSGVYTLDYVLPADVDTVEITPIYFYFTDSTSDMVKTQPNVKFITFYAEDFDKQIQNTWGNTLAVHAWYSGDESDEKTAGYNNNKNTLGGYPGQPMIFSNGEGRYYMQIPTLREDGKSIQGVTMNNYDWDDTHAYVSWGVTGTGESRQNKNCQTYDYDDFAALAYYGAEEIFFTFKYRTNTDNPSDNAELMNKSYYGNGWDAFVDHESRGIDLFGNRLKKFDTLRDDNLTYQSKDSSNTYLSADSVYLTEDFIESDNCDNKIYITSDGYVNYESDSRYNYLGKYATKWTIYKKNGSTFTRIGALPSSAFVPPLDGRAYKLNDDGTMIDTGNDGAANKALFLAYSATSDTARETEWSDFVKIYNACHHLPAVITYEIAKVDSNQPGLRNDGRWYYSKAKERTDDPDHSKIVSNIEIEYMNIGSTGYTPDTIDSTTGIGNTTDATAKFTDTDSLEGSNAIKEITNIDKTKNFNFLADEYSTSSNKTYVFVGWYLKNGDSYTEVNPSDISNVNGSVPRLSGETFVARYKEVSGKTLIVSHKTGSGTGTGTTTSTVKVFNPTTNTYIFNQTSEGVVTVNPNYLTNNSYQITVSIEATAKDGSKYTKTVFSQTENDENPDDITDTITDKTSTHAAYTKYSGGTSNTVSTVFGETSGTKKLFFTSSFDLTTINVKFKYYDRITTNGKEDVDSNPTTVTFTVAYDSTDTIDKLIMKALNGEVYEEDGVKDANSKVKMANVNNLMDDYFFWPSQTDAVNGISELVNYHNDGKKYNADSNAQLAYHTDNYGYPVVLDNGSYKHNTTTIGSSTTELDNVDTWGRWITYKNGDTILTDKSDYTNPNDITSVIVWGYNLPKKYKVNFRYPKDLSTTDVNGNVTAVINDTTLEYNSELKIYTIPSSVQQSDNEGKIGIDVVESYYNQRVGTETTMDDLRKIYFTEAEKENLRKNVRENHPDKKDDELQDEFQSAFSAYITSTIDPKIIPIYNEINGAGNHIKNYGIELGYASGATKIMASENVTFSIKNDEGEVTSTKSLVFDGWYDVDSGVKVTADRMYGNRIIVGQNLVAGYVESDKLSSDIGVSVTKLEQDYYFDKTTNTAKIRFNTGLNVYNAPDDNEGNNGVIQSTAVIYVKLPIDTENGIDTAYWKEQFATTDLSDKLRENILNNLNDKDSFKNGVSGKTGNITFDGQEISWHSANANVEENCDLSNDDVTEYSYGYVNGSDGLKLNNKNRAHYTLNLKLESWETDAAFSAMLVYAAIYSGDQWIMSDNAVDNINATYTPAPVDPNQQ